MIKLCYDYSRKETPWFLLRDDKIATNRVKAYFTDLDTMIRQICESNMARWVTRIATNDFQVISKIKESDFSAKYLRENFPEYLI